MATVKTPKQGSYHYSLWNILSLITLEFINTVGSLIFFGAIFMVMNLSLFTLFPLAIVLNILYNLGYLGFIIVFVYQGLRARECGYSYLPLTPARRVLEFIKQIFLDILFFVLGLIVVSLVFAIGNGIYIAFEIISFAVLLIGQSLLWPIVETIKFYIDNNKIINGYGHGIIKEKKLHGDHKMMQGITETNKEDNNNSSSSKETNSNSLYPIRNIIYDNAPHHELIIPCRYFKHQSFSSLVFQKWRYRMKRLIILCFSWNKLSLYPFGLFYMMFPLFYNKYLTNGYEGVRFLWWHKNTIFEQPNFIINKTSSRLN